MTNTPQDDCRAFIEHQNNTHVHPFTCAGGGGPCHGVNLFPRLSDDRSGVVLECPRCEREQVPAPWMLDAVRHAPRRTAE